MGTLPFSRESFMSVFAAYNDAVWPVQWVAGALGLAMLLALRHPSRGADRLIAGGLAAMWIWTGVAYHAMHFAAINPAAPGFAGLFVVQGLLFAYAGVNGTLRFGRPGEVSATLSIAWLGYAVALYPLLGLMLGHRYPVLPVFGIAPCPVVLFTFGLLLWTRATVPAWLLALPLAWALVGGSAAFLLVMPQDWELFASAALVPLILVRDHARQHNHAPLSGTMT
jgi:hypothetical protein